MNVPCSMFITWLLYCRISFSCRSRNLVGDRWLWEFAKVFLTRISKNVFGTFFKKLLAPITGLASSLIKSLVFFTFIGCKWCSVSTSLQKCFLRFAWKSLLLLHLIIINPPRLTFSARLTLYYCPQGHWEESPHSSLAYQSLSASLNSPLFWLRPNSSSGTMESQQNPIFSLTSVITLFNCSGDFSMTFLDFCSVNSFCLIILDFVSTARVFSGSTYPFSFLRQYIYNDCVDWSCYCFPWFLMNWQHSSRIGSL